ncbi:hypothetical protein NST21_19760 [Peribacillus sp. FSL K6-1552]|uniref:hypothetical protein n=1 Tax=Peribacillus sp. FSL K6-1552 TaxID=2954514 RepID=UPI0030FBB37E
MNSFKGLMKKEWLIGKNALLWLLVVQGGLVFISFLVSRYWEVAGLFYMCTWLIIMMHPLIMILLILGCLSSDGKTQLWIYNPQSAGMLLGCKLLISMVFQMVSIIFSSCLVFVASTIPVSYFQADFQVENSLGIMGLLKVDAFMLTVSIVIAVFLLFLWVVYHALARIHSIKNLRWLLVSALCIGMIMLRDRIVNTVFYQKLDDMWVIKTISETSMTMTDFKLGFYFKAGDTSLLASGLDVIGVVLLFLASCWLLDRKIEV